METPENISRTDSLPLSDISATNNSSSNTRKSQRFAYWQQRVYGQLKNTLEISHGENATLFSMEGLRGLAVFLVFWVHYSSLIAPWTSGSSVNVARFIHDFGHLGVDLFFVLSGYLIYGSIIGKDFFSASKYAKRRIERIYPTFLVVFSIYIALSFVFPGESKLPAGTSEKYAYIIQNLLFIPGLFDINPIITVAWSLSYEVFFYLLIPCVIFLLRLKSWTVEQRLLFWGVVAVMGFALFSMWNGPSRMLMFLSGILLYELYANKQFMLNKGGTRFLLAAIIIFGFRTYSGFSYSTAIFCLFFLLLLLCLCAFNPQTKAYKWLTYTPLRWLGNMSYSYYLIHGLTLKCCFLIFGILVPASFSSLYIYYWLWLPLFAVTIVSSFCLFWVVERPFSLKVKAG